MSDIPGIREAAAYKPTSINQVADMAKGLNITEKGAAIVKEVVGLLGSNPAVRVSQSGMMTTQSVGVPNGPTGIPMLDSPDDNAAKRLDLEALFLKLTIDNEERQTQGAQKRLELQKTKLEQGHKDRLSKIKDSMDKMDKAAKASFWQKLFGWIAAIFACAFAVVTSVASGGVAVGPAIAAVLGVLMCVLNETEAIQKITEGLASLFEKMGMSKEAAQIVANVAFAIAMMALMIACGRIDVNIPLKAVTESAKLTASLLKTAGQIAMLVIGAGGVVISGVNTSRNYKLGMSQAELLDTEKFLNMMRTRMEATEDELQLLMEQIQNAISALIGVLSSETDTEEALAQNMLKMS